MQPCNFNKKLIWWPVASGGLPLLIKKHTYSTVHHHQQTCTFCFFKGRSSSNLLLTKHLVLGGLRKCYWKSKRNKSVSPKKKLDIHNRKFVHTGYFKPFLTGSELYTNPSHVDGEAIFASSLLVRVVSQNVGEKNPSEPRWNLDFFKLRRGSFSKTGVSPGNTFTSWQHHSCWWKNWRFHNSQNGAQIQCFQGFCCQMLKHIPSGKVTQQWKSTFSNWKYSCSNGENFHCCVSFSRLEDTSLKIIV